MTALIVAGGCASEPLAKQRFLVQRKWVLPTIQQIYKGPQALHRMAPILYKDFVIQGNSIDGIVALDRKTGALRWKVAIEGGVEAEGAVDQNRLFIGARDGNFYSINIESGQIIWSFSVQSEVLGAPLIEKGRLYFLNGVNSLYCLDATSGKLQWLYARKVTSNQSLRGGSRPVIIGETLYVGTSDGYLVAIKKSSGELLWDKRLNTNRRFQDVDSSPVADGNDLFVSSFDDGLYALDAHSGVVKWKVDEGGFLPVVLDGDRLLHSTGSGKVMAIDRKSGKTLWEFILPQGGVATEPVFYRGLAIFVESQGPLRFLDSMTGRPVAEFFSGRGGFARPTVDSQSGTVYFISNEAHLYALKVGWEKGLPWPWFARN